MAHCPHSSHWGAYSVEHDAAGDIRRIVPHPADPDPSPLLGNVEDVLTHRVRVDRPAVRRGWLLSGPGPDSRRGQDDFVSVSWREALDLVAGELDRTRRTAGPAGVFGGSYGWSSAGRFHHAQSQVHRFLNTCVGGYVRSVGSYSGGAAQALLPHVLGDTDELSKRNVTWAQMTEHTDVVLAFGGMALKNTTVGSGGVSRHLTREALRRAASRGTRFVLVGPLRTDLPDSVDAEWIAPVPGTDSAMMLGLAHTLLTDGTADQQFLDRCCVGSAELTAHLTGARDGTVRDAGWAAEITGIPAREIRALARSLVGRRVVVTVAQSLQRAEHGEQPLWAGIALAAVLGQLGLPGGGFNYGLGSLAQYGLPPLAVSPPVLPQGHNGVDEFIPVARIADMLLHPGEPFSFNGSDLRYPHVRLAYWAGGNPFHHHQDLGRLRRALARLDTFVVHEQVWTATARHADIVLPATSTLEREDIGAAQFDPRVIAMHRAVAPRAEARDDYRIFTELARRLGREAEFTEGRDTRGWLRHLYAGLRDRLQAAGHEAPDFEQFWADGELLLPTGGDDGGRLRALRADPRRFPLDTPSGRVELYSARIDGFDYDDCPGVPTWLPPADAPDGDHPFWLVANQPATRLHSQLDFGTHSRSHKVDGREVVLVHPDDAAHHGIDDGDVVRLSNARGSCLAAARLGDDVRPGVVQLPTGAWFTPEDPAAVVPTCLHGNPNVVTRDVGTSRLGQGSTGQLTAVRIERVGDGAPSPARAHEPPILDGRRGGADPGRPDGGGALAGRAVR